MRLTGNSIALLRYVLISSCVQSSVKFVFLVCLPLMPITAYSKIKTCSEIDGNARFNIPSVSIKDASTFLLRTSNIHLVNNGIITNIENINSEDIYYDTKRFSLKSNNSALKIRTINNLSKYDKNRKRIVFSSYLNNKYTNTVFYTKKYKRLTSQIDRHPLVGLIKRSERSKLFELLRKTPNTKPESLREILKVNRDETARIIYSYNIPYAIVSISLENIKTHGIDKLQTYANFITLENNIRNSRELIKIKNEITELACIFKNSFPKSTLLDTSDYSEHVEIAKTIFPDFGYFIKNKLDFRILQAFVLSSILFLIFYLLFSKRKQIDGNYKIIKRNHD